MQQRESLTGGDLEYVRRAQAGDTKAFEYLYRRHSGRVYAVCLRLAADPARAAEWTQDAFVRAWEKLETFRGDSAFSSWLHRVAVNVALVALRTQRRRAVHVHPTDVPERYDLRSTAPPERIDLEQAIACLPPGARTVFVLHDVEGYRHDEIAALIEVAPGTSKAQLHRARKLLRKALRR